MNANTWMQAALFIVVLIALAIPLGRYIADVLDGTSVVVRKIGRPVETLLYRIAGVDPNAEMSWKHYVLAVLLFNALGALVLYALLRLQGMLPANPQSLSGMTPDAAFNTAVSFVTNTNWQNYGSESTLGYLAQMLGLTVQNFLSAATGIAVVVALIRGFKRHSVQTIGNFWVDLTRTTLYVLAPLAIVFSLVFVSQGAIQNFRAYEDVPTLQVTTYQTQSTDAQGKQTTQTLKADKQTLPMGPVACVGEISAEQAGNPLYASLRVDTQASALHPGGSMEGKETRFGIVQSGLFTVATTAAPCGAVDNMNDSLTPLGGLVPMLLIQLGEVIFGGVGSGLYGMRAFALLAVFVAGLMIGRMPEYVGKKIESYEMKMVSIVILLTPLLVLAGTSVAVPTSAGTAGTLPTHGPLFVVLLLVGALTYVPAFALGPIVEHLTMIAGH